MAIAHPAREFVAKREKERERCRNNNMGCALERGKRVMNEGAKSFLVDSPTVSTKTPNLVRQHLFCFLSSRWSYPHHREREGRVGLKPPLFSWVALIGGGWKSCVCAQPVGEPTRQKFMDRVWDLLRRNMYTRLRRQILLRNQ